MSVPILYAGSKYKPGVFVPIPGPIVPPEFLSAEIGAVNASTVAVTFDSSISASNYATGVTIKVNDAATTITSATRQANHAVVRYVIPVLWHGSGDTVTWEYASGSGNIVSESDSTPLGDVTAQSATNNCGYETLSDLQADTLALNDGDPISTWSDGQGNDYTQTGRNRPTKVTVGGYPAYYSLGVTDDEPTVAQYLRGPNIADNLPKFSIIYIGKFDRDRVWSADTIAKISVVTGAGWRTQINKNGDPASLDLVTSDGISSSTWAGVEGAGDSFAVFSVEKLASDVTHAYINGSNTGEITSGSITDGTYSNSVGIVVGSGDFDLPSTAWSGWLRAVMIIQLTNITNWAIDRAALEARLAARYGITL